VTISTHRRRAGMTTVFKSEIEWRSDIAAAPRDKRILMIATSMVPNEINDMPDLVVVHWYEGTEQWVAADVYGEPRPGARLALKPIYWAELGNLPPGTLLRELTIEDFRG
jgi:hypothetical protein